MVRLQTNDAQEMGGKRSRPTSSLDFKADPAEPKLIAMDNAYGSSRSSSRASSQSSQKTDPTPQRNDFAGKRYVHPTRSRGSGGIPKLPRTLADLDRMSQEEVAEALYNDPLLAEQLKERYEQQKQQKQQQEAGHTRRSSSKSSGGGGTSFVKGGDRVTILKENGIPYQQWGILLICIGIGLYQLYKAMKPPASGKKGSKNKIKSASLTKSQMDDAVIAELEGSVAKASHAAWKKTKKKKLTKSAKPSTASESAAHHTTPVRPKTLPERQSQTEILFEDDLLDEGEWKTVGSNVVPKAKVESTNPAVAVADDAITVHTSNTSKKKKKNGAATVSTTPTVPTSSLSTSDVTTLSSIPEEKTGKAGTSNGKPSERASEINGTSGADPHEDPSPQGEEALQEEPDMIVKKKKIKKKKAKEADSTSAEAVVGSNGLAHTATDAALAQQLQQEEDKLVREQLAVEAALAAGTNGAPIEADADDAWAEVTKKKKPPKVVTPVASATESDAATDVTKGKDEPENDATPAVTEDDEDE
jgi:hypothetical protein